MFITERVEIGNTTIMIDVPNPDSLLDQSLAAEAVGLRPVDPYWGVIWDSARHMARALLHADFPASALCHSQSSTDSKSRTETLELGCGVGLTGIAALVAGLQVTFSDMVPDAVELSCRNAAANGFPSAKGVVLDWNLPLDARFNLIIASDILYDVALHEPLLNLLSRMLKASGSVIIGDTGRKNSHLFFQQARVRQWEIHVYDQNWRRLPGPVHNQFQLARLTSPFRHDEYP